MLSDPGFAKKYIELWAPIALHYGAEVVAGKNSIDTREGPHYPRQLVIRFPSFEDAVQCYEDPRYEEAMKVARQAFDRELSILEG